MKNIRIPALVTVLSLFSWSSLAQIELLQIPAKFTSLAEKSVLMALTANQDELIVVGERGHILSNKDGQTWQQQGSPVSVALTSVALADNGVQVAVGHDAAILYKASAEHLWQKVFDGYELTKLRVESLTKQLAQMRTSIEALTDEDEIDEATFQLEELEFTLEDAQAELEAGPNKPLLAVIANDENHFFALGAYGTLLKSTDGKHWQLIDSQLDNPDKFHLNAITHGEEQQLFIVGENGLAFRSNDNGMNWELLDLPYQGSLFGVIYHSQAKALVAFGLQGNIMVSFDHGDSWNLLDNPSTISLLGGVASDAGQIYLVGHGGTILSFDINNYQQININKHPSGAAFSSAVIQNNKLILAGQFGLASWQVK